MKKNFCTTHGEMTLENAYACKNPNGTIRLRCKQCCHDRRVEQYFKTRDASLEYSKKWKEENRDYVRENAKENYHKDVVTKRKKELARKKGLRLEEYDQMVKACDGKCHICGKEEKRKGRAGFVSSNLSIDHCHNTGKIRGLLCHDCNTGIGKLKDDTELMMKAIEYLRKNQ